MPPGTPYMALTATATKSVHSEVIRCLEMEKCVQISLSPDRPNIFYEVSARTSIELDLAWLMLSLRDNVQKTPRVMVYCQSLGYVLISKIMTIFFLNWEIYHTIQLVLHISVKIVCSACSMHVLPNTTKTSFSRAY